MEVSSIGNVKDDCSCGVFDSGAPKSEGAKPREQQQRVDKCPRVGLFAFSAITGVLYAGAFFSWGAMQLLLENHGVFEERCSVGEASPCPAQTTRLLNVQFVAQFAVVLSPLLGVIVDRYGAVKLMYVTATCGCLGLGLLTLAVGIYLDNLVFVAFLLIGVMAMASVVNIVQVGLLFRAVIRQRVISVLNALFDAGHVTYLALWGIQNSTGCSLLQLLLPYLGIGLVCFGGSIYFWRVVMPAEDVGSNSDTEQKVDDSDDEGEDVSSPDAGDVPLEPDKLNEDRLEPPRWCLSTNSSSGLGATERGSASDVEGKRNDNAVTADDDYVLIATRPPMKQLQSKQFVTLTIFFAIHATREVFNLTTARAFLGTLGDDETGNRFLTIYTLLTPASIIFLPVLDFVLTHYGYHVGLQVVNVLALGQGIIMVASDNLNVQVLGFVFASLFRCFLYTISLAILPTFLGVNAVGKASGITPCAAGILSLVNIPMASWAVKNGNFFTANLIYTLVVIPCIYAAWVLGQGIKRENAAKERLLKSK